MGNSLKTGPRSRRKEAPALRTREEKKMKMRFNKVRKWLAALLALVLLAAALPASADSGFAAVVTAKSMALYANASLTQQFATLSQRDVVHVNAFSGNVAHVTNKYGVSGYAKVSDMVAVDAIAREAYVNENTRVYEDYNTNSNFTTLAKGTAVDVIAVAGEWALIEKNSIGGYTYARYLTYTNGENAGGVAPTAAPTAAPTTAPAPTDSIPGIVVRPNTPVYANPSTSAQQIGVLVSDARVNVCAVQGEWALIELSGNYGYCQVINLGPAEVLSEYVTGTVLQNCPVYSDPRTNSTQYFTLTAGSKVNIHFVAGDWAFVSQNGNYGYCASACVTEGSAPTAAPTTAPAPTDSIPGIVVRPNTPVYANPSTSAQQIGVLVSDARVNVCAVQGEWALIELSGNYGYCQVINLGPAEVLSEYVTGTVLQNCPVYSDPRTNSTQYFTLTAGSKGEHPLRRRRLGVRQPERQLRLLCERVRDGRLRTDRRPDDGARADGFDSRHRGAPEHAGVREPEHVGAADRRIGVRRAGERVRGAGRVGADRIERQLRLLPGDQPGPRGSAVRVRDGHGAAELRGVLRPADEQHAVFHADVGFEGEHPLRCRRLGVRQPERQLRLLRERVRDGRLRADRDAGPDAAGVDSRHRRHRDARRL